MRNGTMRMGIMMCIILFVLVSFVGCAKPPTEEMSQARLAFDQATTAGAQNYARDQYMSAEEALNKATALMESKKYKEAREKAMEATSLARKAHSDAVEGKNAMNMSALAMYNQAVNAMNAANAAGAYTYAEVTMLEAQRTLQEAKALYDNEDYIAAKEKAEAALVKARSAEVQAKSAVDTKRAEMSRTTQQQAGGMADPGITPRPYPTSHVVIKGESLWWIAEYKQVYNDPFQWPLIYKANRAKINDPDLIFPGQEFKIVRQPELTDEMVKDAIRFAQNRGAWSLHDGK